MVDFRVETGGNEFTVLQITDMQVIDALQQRYEGRLKPDEFVAWQPENAEKLCYAPIRELVQRCNPTLILITGDITYGQFDDSGRVQTEFVEFMESLGIPWAPVFGNHDNETRMGIDWQCAQYEAAEHCLFRRGTVTGNGNYTVGLMHGEKLLRVIYLLDSNGCAASEEPEKVCREQGLQPDQLEWIRTTAEKMEAQIGHPVPSFAAFHIPTWEFACASVEAGYQQPDTPETFAQYVLGETVPAKGDDFGRKEERLNPKEKNFDFWNTIAPHGFDGVFAGHLHKVNTCIRWRGIRWVFGVKTGWYDYHNQTGGTKITLSADAKTFTVEHLLQETKDGNE